MLFTVIARAGVPALLVATAAARADAVSDWSELARAVDDVASGTDSSST